MLDFPNLDSLTALAGQMVGVSDWVVIDQRRIDTFAEATGDRQWIHVDAERCRRESPFGSTVAHGFLTLSLLSTLLEQTLTMSDMKMGVNYGLNKVRFPAPVPVDSRVRARIGLASVEPFEGGAQLTWDVTLEREGGTKPVCVAEWLIRRYP